MRIADRRHDWNIKRTQESRQGLIHTGIAAHAVGNDGQPIVGAAYLGHQQQAGDATGAGVNIDIRGQHWHQDFIGVGSQFGHFCRVDGGRRVDDDAAGLIGNAQLKGARHAAVFLIGVDQMDRRLAGLTLARPARRGSLRVEIHQRRPLPLQGVVTRQVYRNRRLA